MREKVKRKTLMAREDLADRLSAIAKNRHKTLFNMLNEVLELVIQAEEAGVNLRGVFEDSCVLKAARKAGFILGLESLWYEMAEFAYGKARRKTLKSWSEAGAWLAKRYITGDAEDPFEAFRGDLEAFTWNTPELTIERTGNEVSIRIVSPRFPESYTVLYAAFIEGALKTFGYKVADRDVSRGNIRLKAVRKEGHVEG
ncbi:MAG: hypothetical protein ACTSUS_07565 [Candidatus Freyarchaeota archaeon]